MPEGKPKMRISVIGAGYVGLTTAACLAELGHHVFCAENDEQKLRSLQEGEVPIFEPYLEEMVHKNCRLGRLTFGMTAEAINFGECIFICVGTPPLDDGEADLSAIERVAQTIARSAHGYRLVIEKSTVPVQTAYQLTKHLALHNSNGFNYDVASNPEFLREGSAVENFFHPDRVVVGAEEERAAALMREIYSPILSGTFRCPVHTSCEKKEIPFLLTSTSSAELIKHASNSFLAMKISFINLVADLCEAAGADINHVAHGIGLDPRIGSAFLNPGIGFGGFCFPKDLQAFVKIADKFGCDFALFREVEKVNQERISRFVAKVKDELWVLRGKTIAVWGLAFKPNTDDVRFAPALSVIRQLLSEGALIKAYDPKAMANARKQLPDITYCGTAYEAAENADCILILTEWSEFRDVDWQRVISRIERPIVIDGRNALRAQELADFGIQYIGIGTMARTLENVSVLSGNYRR
jgi:UDPglucose 6-dehydrogenase